MMTWVLDLDGVVWLAGQPFPGAAAAVEKVREHDGPVAFFTNNSGPTLAEHAAALAGAGIRASQQDLLTSAQAAARLLEPGTRVAMIGGAGLGEALKARRVTLVATGEQPAAVVVGRTTDLDFEELSSAAAAIHAGSRFIATNTDATFPTPDGAEPGAGALVAFLQVASGVEPEVAGKPYPPAVALVRERVGEVTVVVGDRPDTDGYFARALGAQFLLVLSGVTKRSDLPVDPHPDVVSDDLATAVAESFPC